MPENAESAVPALTDSYQKAHKNYVLWSALLASWQLIGIELETKEKWGVVLKSPQAVPLVLFCLVLYFGFKMTIEWMQCDANRRKHLAAKIDYRVAHGIALTAIAISLTQYLWRIRVLDLLNTHLAFSVTLGCCGLTIYYAVEGYTRWKRIERLVVIVVVANISEIILVVASIFVSSKVLMIIAFIVPFIMLSFLSHKSVRRLQEASDKADSAKSGV